jgi:Carboxypeptidase regulatory-like domain/TonB-dependent Receptor Plug Domain
MRTFKQQIAVATLSFFVLVVAAGQQVAAQTIRGTLLDQLTNKPIAGATVTLETEGGTPVGPTVRTGNDGTFSITAPAAGTYRLRADLSGYISAMTPAIDLGPSEEVNITWRLLAGVVAMRPVTITSTNHRTNGRLSGFYDRAQRHGFGYFITADKIQQMRPFSVSDILRTVPGLQVIPSPRGFGNIVRTIEGCTPAVYLDGVRFPLMGESIDDIVNPMDLEGIEVYTHAAEVPPEFSEARSNCGAIALWTKNY